MTRAETKGKEQEPGGRKAASEAAEVKGGHRTASHIVPMGTGPAEALVLDI